MRASSTRTMQPVSQAQQHNRSFPNGVRIGVLAGIILFFAVPHIPGDAWKNVFWENAADLLLTPLIPGDVLSGADVPTLQVIYWGMAAFLGWLDLTLLLHVAILIRQCLAPLSQQRAYLRLRTHGASEGSAISDGQTLLATLHSVLPPADGRSTVGAPLSLVWTGLPQHRIQQGVSVVAEPAPLVASVLGTLRGIGGGTDAVDRPDPLRAACTAGRVLASCDLQFARKREDTLPIAMPERGQSATLASLLPQLQPQRGIHLVSVRVLLRPLPQLWWERIKVAVQAHRDRLKPDAHPHERAVIDKKAEGPGYAATPRVIVVADTADAATAQLQSLVAVCAARQEVGGQHQALVAGPISILPCGIAPKRLPRTVQLGTLVLGVVVAAALAYRGWQLGLLDHHPLLWVILPLVALLPLLLTATLHAWFTRRRHAEQLLSILNDVPPPLNPQCVPIWAAWLGHRP